MKYIIIILSFILINSSKTTAQTNFGRPYTSYSKNQRKVLRSFHSGKRHKRYIRFKNRSHIYNPTVKKDTKRILKRRYREDIMTRNIK